MTQDRIVLHYLIGSRASRILWLLEELDVEYEMKSYHRTSEGLAPPELKAVWPLGLSPVVQVFRPGAAKPLTLAESGQIVLYLISHYDPQGKFRPESEDDQVLVDYYLHFAEGSLQCHLVSLLVNYVACQRAPWGLGWLVKSIMGKINGFYYLKKIRTAYAFLDQQLEEKNGGYFVGNKLTGADFILDFPVNENLFANPARLEEMGAGVNGERDFPRLAEWNKLITGRLAHVRASEKGQEAKAKL
ncbi:glutathione S-transferase [Metschnikowia bicuspidata var. bicuspidata NRRL YB-4993]|uniref:Glutathione S-transferase n=1 Tax=Metschnikowia bicuspidata var. bicuspidata NRRL YB-4993 TaxID=869754 RepID=A0A1A0HE92_9ASCO|nr:glutathione S-transferase [Metschnikowia bicuspidata var. bicuspidata NRRL YB-4993]OBA22429.1 glutathione S-transferase [Metschnikowia bicuspidata var. bicuspidata NRRL YB-4993]